MSTTEDREQNVYEVGYLLLPSIPEDALSETVNKIYSIVEKAGGKKFDGEEPFLQTLAYQMAKNVGARKYVVDEAYLGWFKFELEPEKVEEVKKGMEALEEVLRFLLIKAPRETTFSYAEARAKKQREFEAQNAEAQTVSEAPAEPEPAKEDVVE